MPIPLAQAALSMSTPRPSGAARFWVRTVHRRRRRCPIAFRLPFRLQNNRGLAVSEPASPSIIYGLCRVSRFNSRTRHRRIPGSRRPKLAPMTRGREPRIPRRSVLKRGGFTSRGAVPLPEGMDRPNTRNAAHIRPCPAWFGSRAPMRPTLPSLKSPRRSPIGPRPALPIRRARLIRPGPASTSRSCSRLPSIRSRS